VKRAAILLILLLPGLGFWLAWRFHRKTAGTHLAAPPAEPRAANVSVATVTSPGLQMAGKTNPLPGEIILRDYASIHMPPENDLVLMSRLMENSLLLLKSAANRPLSANEDWAGLFRGENAARERFLPDQHAALNSKGRLVDRWGTPLFFHALGGGRHDIRSAGPDRAPWTADDIHRNANGSFRRGSDLNPASLLPDSYPPSMPVR
jgi:hypothetical protein